MAMVAKAGAHQPDARSGRRNRKPPVQNIRVQAMSSTRLNHRVNVGVQLCSNVAEGVGLPPNSLPCQCRTARDETKLTVHKPKVSTFML